MGIGEIRDSTTFEIQERGEIYFFFRPKVGIEEPHSGDDVQRMYLVLRPEVAEKVVEEKQSSDSGKEGKFREEEVEEALNETDLNGPDVEEEETTVEAEPIEIDNKAEEPAADETNGAHIVVEHAHKNGALPEAVTKGGHGTEVTAVPSSDTKRVEIGKKPLFRYIVMGRKSLPPASKHTSPYWGFVELVTTNPEDLKKVLAEDQYDTKTRGHRVNPAARPAGEGVYSLVRHHTATKTSTHLVYKLEHPGPHKKHEPQEAMNIEALASFVIQIKNPEQPAPASTGVGSKRRAFFPAHLQGKIGSRRFLPADPPDLLNYEGVEFILVSPHDDIDAELGLDLKTSDAVAKEVPDLVELLGSHRGHKHHLIRPLIEGEWA